jgi:Domain of unknown function (DUF5680)
MQAEFQTNREPTMGEFERAFIDFLIEAKRHTYAAGMPPTGSSRRASKDLGYAYGDYEYLDSYFGAAEFIGQELVYRKGIPIWGMNYYGRATADADDGEQSDAVGMGDVLHAALMKPPLEAPYRGPRSLVMGDCAYRCDWTGLLEGFHGEEEILRSGERIYFLRFHGGSIR